MKQWHNGHKRKKSRKPARKPAPRRQQPKPLIIKVQRSFANELLVQVAMLCLAAGLACAFVAWYRLLVHL